MSRPAERPADAGLDGCDLDALPEELTGELRALARSLARLMAATYLQQQARDPDPDPPPRRRRAAPEQFAEASA